MFRKVTLVASTAVLVLISGCAPGEKSAELGELEQELQSPEGQALRNVPNAVRYHEESRQYRRAAEEARLDRDDELSREYAMLGLLRYRTAVAFAAQFEAVERLQEANQAIEEINPRVRATSQARNELAREIRELEEEIRLAVRSRDEERRQEEAAVRGSLEPTERDSGAVMANFLETIAESVAEAERLREEAREVRAHEIAPTQIIFDRAVTQLENAQALLEREPGAAETVLRQVNFSAQLFEEAKDVATPIHREWVEKMRPENRINTLRREARNNFGSPFTEEEPDGIRIVMARLFEPREAEFRRSTEAVLDVLRELATEYEEFTIEIYGYTQRGGGATRNLATSQLRAQQVRDLLIDAGVDEHRITTEGFGQDNIRYPDREENNDRVEVIFVHSNPQWSGR